MFSAPMTSTQRRVTFGISFRIEGFNRPIGLQ